MANRLLQADVQKCFVKKVFLQISQNSQERTCARVSFLIKLQACNFIKRETLAQMFFCEFCEISKNSFFYRTPPLAASGGFLKYNCFGNLIVTKRKNIILDIFYNFYLSNVPKPTLSTRTCGVTST